MANRHRPRRRNRVKPQKPVSNPFFAPHQVVLREIDRLHPDPDNPRRHTDQQIALIEANISHHGFLFPILVDENDKVLAGHTRLKAAKKLGLSHVPITRVEHLSEAQKKAVIVADNRLAELASWDDALLSRTFEFLFEAGIDFNVELTGFETPEIDLIMDAASSDAAAEEDVLPVVDPKLPPVSKAGDLWLMGDHSILCDDATVAASYERLLGGAKAQMIITDPP